MKSGLFIFRAGGDSDPSLHPIQSSVYSRGFPATQTITDQLTRLLRGRLRPHQSSYQRIEVGWVDVADGDDVEVWRGGGVEGEACAGVRQRREAGTGGSLRQEDGDFVFVDGEEEQRRGLAVEVGEVCAFEGRVGG